MRPSDNNVALIEQPQSEAAVEFFAATESLFLTTYMYLLTVAECYSHTPGLTNSDLWPTCRMLIDDPKHFVACLSHCGICYLSSLAIASSELDCSRHVLSSILVGAGRPHDVYFIAKYLIHPQICTRTLS
jgi:hypothetical protein